MILSVSFEKTIYNALPYKFEAGTPDISGAIGLAAAVDYLEALGPESIAAHERELLAYAVDALSAERDVRLVGTPRERRARCRSSSATCTRTTSAPCSIATGSPSAPATTVRSRSCSGSGSRRRRASFGLYNTREDVDALVRGLHAVREMFA